MHILPLADQSSDLNSLKHFWNYLDRQKLCLEQRYKQILEDTLKAKFYSLYFFWKTDKHYAQKVKKGN